MNQVVNMKDLATFIVINMKENAKIPADLVEALKKNGWLMVRNNSTFVLLWESILEKNGKNVGELMGRVEDVRVMLRRLNMKYKIRTKGADQTPT